MKTYDWIAIGAGITGSAVSYELSKLGFRVLLLDRMAEVDRATRYSYGIVFWYGTSGSTGQLFHEGKDRHHRLSEELGIDTEFRPRHLLLTLDRQHDVDATIAQYQNMSNEFQVLSPQEASEVEPLLNPKSIAGALTIQQAHVNPIALNQGYQQGMIRHGGAIATAQVERLEQNGDRTWNVATSEGLYHGKNVVVCAGGWTRHLLNQAGVKIPVYFTHAEVIEIPQWEYRLSTILTTAQSKRDDLQNQASTSQWDELWDRPGHEPVPRILDAGAIQFQGGRLLLGQISRVLTDPQAKVDAQESERRLRQKVEQMLPRLAQSFGTWHSCLVAFSHKRLAVVGAVPNRDGLYVFSGFTAPMTLVPAIAPRFARQVAGSADPLLLSLGLDESGS